jgi:hypothetical protein
MASKPEPTALASVFGIVLSVAAILAIMTWSHSNLAAPIPPEAIYHPQLLLLY